MTSSEGGQTLKAITTTTTTTTGSLNNSNARMEVVAAAVLETTCLSATQTTADLVEATNYCSRTQRKRIIKWLGGVQQESCCTCSTPQPQRVVGQDVQGNRSRQATCSVCGGMVDMTVSIDGLRRKQSSGTLFSTSGMLSRVGKVFGRRGEDAKQKAQQEKQKTALGPLVDGHAEPDCAVVDGISGNKDLNDSSSDSTETQPSEHTLAWLSGDGSSGADGGGGAGGNKKPDLGLDEKAARLRRAQKLLNKSGNG